MFINFVCCVDVNFLSVLASVLDNISYLGNLFRLL